MGSSVCAMRFTSSATVCPHRNNVVTEPALLVLLHKIYSAPLTQLAKMKLSTHPFFLAMAVAISLAAFAPTVHAATRDLDRDGIPNSSDPDIDNDGIPNSLDLNIDGGLCKSGPLRGRYIGDRIPNDSLAELDIDDDGKLDDALEEEDIDGDRRNDDAASELDIDGDRRNDDAVNELDIDGDGLLDDSSLEDDTDGDGRRDGIEDSDDDGDGRSDSVDDDDDGDGHRGRNRGGDDDDETDDDDDGTALPAAQVGDGNAPSSVTGITYLVSEDGTQVPERVEFTSTTDGRVVDGSDIDPFTFTYTANGTTATVRLQFKSDKWDDYSFDFATGHFSRSEYDKNTLKDTDVGTFALPQ